MIGSRLIHRCSLFPKFTRQFNKSSLIRNQVGSNLSETQKASDAAQQARDKNVEEVLGSQMYAVNNFDRKLLVWVKRYPSIADVPDKVTHECILQARSRARVKVCNIMILLSIIGFLWAVFSGKSNVKSGNTIANQMEEYHKNLKREAMAEAAAKAEAAERIAVSKS